MICTYTSKLSSSIGSKTKLNYSFGRIKSSNVKVFLQKIRNTTLSSVTNDFSDLQMLSNSSAWTYQTIADYQNE